jgi:GMC oxidoreductase
MPCRHAATCGHSTSSSSAVAHSAPPSPSTTHHEAGTLRMGDNPTTSVTDANCHFHGVKNAYVVGPALFPTIGSPNPMLTGIALARRLGDHLLPPPPAASSEAGFRYLFDGSEKSGDLFAKWIRVGGGDFILVGRIRTNISAAARRVRTRIPASSACRCTPGTSRSPIFA